MDYKTFFYLISLCYEYTTKHKDNAMNIIRNFIVNVVIPSRAMYINKPIQKDSLGVYSYGDNWVLVSCPEPDCYHVMFNSWTDTESVFTFPSFYINRQNGKKDTVFLI